MSKQALTNTGFSKRDNYTRCKNSAIYSLAMREHSRQEIYQKLCRKEYRTDVDLEALLDELEESNYLSNERFTESFIRSRVSRGQGSVKIMNELRMRGIKESLIVSAMQEANIDWFAIATEQYEKKFGKKQKIDFSEKAKQMRFLTGRGFAAEIVRAVVG